MFVHVLRNIGHVKVRVAVVRELFQFRIKRFLPKLALRVWFRRQTKTHPSEANLVSKVMKPTDTVLSIFKVVILDESESEIYGQLGVCEQ